MCKHRQTGVAILIGWECIYEHVFMCILNKESNAFRNLLLHCRVKGTNANSQQTSQLREFLWHWILFIPPTAMNAIWHQLQTVHIPWNPMDPTIHPTQQRTALLHTQVLHTQHDAKKKQELMRSEILMEERINITVFWDVTPCTLVKSSVPHMEEAGTSKTFILLLNYREWSDIPQDCSLEG